MNKSKALFRHSPRNATEIHSLQRYFTCVSINNERQIFLQVPHLVELLQSCTVSFSDFEFVAVGQGANLEEFAHERRKRVQPQQRPVPGDDEAVVDKDVAGTHCCGVGT